MEAPCPSAAVDAAGAAAAAGAEAAHRLQSVGAHQQADQRAREHAARAGGREVGIWAAEAGWDGGRAGWKEWGECGLGRLGRGCARARRRPKPRSPPCQAANVRLQAAISNPNPSHCAHRLTESKTTRMRTCDCRQ